MLMEKIYNGGGDNSEEELSVLPRHTKVVVTGNNRTKSVIVGLQGVVKKAVGLGGWHWLVLTNGIEVKLQRNALSVIEPPTGNEDDDDLEFQSVQWNVSDFASDDTQRSHRIRHRHHKSTVSSHKTVSRSLSCDSQSKTSYTTSRGSVKVDLSKLEMAALRRYWRHFNLVDVISNPSKEQLIDIVQSHFMSQIKITKICRVLSGVKTLDELQVIVGFAQAAKKLKMVCN
ncbi:histone deacetylase complex subunit SAP30/SAP30-like protein [Tanacetum coccineum]